MLAGVSVDYYTRLEKGNLRTASDQVLDAIAEALRLDPAERSHLFDLARSARSRTAPVMDDPRVTSSHVTDSLRPILDGMIGTPALISNGRLDILAANPLARGLYAPVFDSPTRAPKSPANLARFRSLDPASRDFYPDWAESADAPVAILRYQAGQYPRDTALSNLVGELSTRSDEFRTRWAAHNVRTHDRGAKRINHPVVGEIALDFDAMTVDANRSLRFMVYTARPDTRDAETLALLGSWITSETALKSLKR
ncbi:helix-turn-helix transcriptional regulator [Brevibacterium renqingii]|uniref:helix-turn-helix transcriptional regulator n=1 Tax=Brevibacterium renqingii TaxID=2776916 RepID=UPI001FEC8B0A|nr:helix-turn-helix transcriptional regulator [Brevibacterium renqingii]